MMLFRSGSISVRRGRRRRKQLAIVQEVNIISADLNWSFYSCVLSDVALE